MKQLIILSVLVILFSCSRSSNTDRQNNLSKYYGIYNSSDGDTMELTAGNGSYTIFRRAIKNVGTRMICDSVLINEDGSFTDNEIAKIRSGSSDIYYYSTSVGSGSFGTNTIDLYFVLDGAGHFRFNGVKRQ